MNPTDEAFLKLLWTQKGKHPAECVVRGYATRQLQEGFKLGFLGSSIICDIDPVVGATYDGADGNGDDVVEVVANFETNSRIFQ